VTKVSFEEIKSLVKLEKEADKKLALTREEAAKIVENAEEAARKISKDVDEQDLSVFVHKRLSEIEEKKKSIEKETEQKAAELLETGNKNIEKTIRLIASLVLGECS
jgi:vacuolar-type H+-ATPase subunit H